MKKDNRIKKKNLKIFCMLLVITIITNMSSVFASYNNSNIDLGKYKIYYNKNENRYIKYNSVSQRFFDYYYIDNNGEKCPAYCIALGTDGAEKEVYEVNIAKELDDVKLKNIILNGYPYKTYGELGVDNKEAAKFATQFAIWVYMNNLDLSKIEPLTLNDIKVKNAIENIYHNGLNTNVMPNQLDAYTLSEEFNIDDIDARYYSNKYVLKYNENIKEIRLQNNSYNIKITDYYNNEIDKITNQKEIKILVPREQILENKDIDIEFEYVTKENSVMFGASTKENMQNVAIALTPVKTCIYPLTLKINYIKTPLEILKVDADDKKTVIPNVKFRFWDGDMNNILGEYITNNEGKIEIDLQKDLNILENKDIYIEEIEVPDDYYIDKNNNIKKVSLMIGKENNIVFENEKIKGRIKIIKTSKNDNALSGLKER